MDKIKKSLAVLTGVILIIFAISGLEILTGKVILVDKNKNLVQEDKPSKISIFPKVVVLEKIGDFVIKDKIGVEVIPGSAGAYKKVEFFKYGSSEVFEEFNLKCIGFKCRKKITGYQTVDNKWKSGKYTARIKDAGTQKYIKTDFLVENNL